MENLLSKKKIRSVNMKNRLKNWKNTLCKIKKFVQKKWIIRSVKKIPLCQNGKSSR
jgi:hypothetical protein